MKVRDLVLQDIERLKKLQPMMEKLGIAPDGWWRSIDDGKTWFFTSREDQDPQKLTTDCVINIPTYRQDKLAGVLPKWFDDRHLRGLELEIVKRLKPGQQVYQHNTWVSICTAISVLENSKRGQPQLESTADLLILCIEHRVLHEKELA